jgi:hypothetical protein
MEMMMNQPHEDVWPGWIPAGVPTYFAAPRGMGTTTLLADWAARVTNGDKMPDGHRTAKGSVILLNREESDSTMLRLLLAGGADLRKLYTNVGMPDLDRMIEEIGDVRLVVIDQLVNYSPNDPRAAHWIAGNLKRLTAEHDIGLIAVIRTMKVVDAHGMGSGQGAAFTDAAGKDLTLLRSFWSSGDRHVRMVRVEHDRHDDMPSTREIGYTLTGRPVPHVEYV